uniref:Calcium-binding EF-hand,IPR002160 Proteinase inhibitor I3, Kunitz legume,domain-containing protein n=1 Tax=Schistosoma japonicum TaxID=6182 RepID=C1LEP0_SCHJA|nr:Calcium-binding EF-hand,IPR002160 Proteinase inhibitor I3, Kunitz legume,domain-containing protein [Schistosoma japonicum]
MQSKKDIDEFVKIFHELDRNHDGYISRTELMSKVGTKSIDRHKVQELMQLFDINGDGMISLGEYKLILGLTGQSIDNWIRLFRKLDKDHSGSLDFHEMCSLFGGDHSCEVRKSVKNYMKKYDKDRDGRIDIKEFLTFVAEQAEHPVV